MNLASTRINNTIEILHNLICHILNSITRASKYLTGKLLDVGCGKKPYASIFNCEIHVGVDVSTSPHINESIDEYFDGLNLPFQNESFDSVICTEVLEHCQNAEKLMLEMYRVLRPGGFIFFTVPMFIEHHEAPHDMRRYTYYGARSLAEQCGLEIVEVGDRGNFLSVSIVAFYYAISQYLSRRPYIDFIYWLLFPFTWLTLKFDRFKRKDPVSISLGWQFLVKKAVSE